MKYSSKYSANSPLYIKLRSIYVTKKQINNSKMSNCTRLHMMNECDKEANLAWRNHYAGKPGYELIEARPMSAIATTLRTEYEMKVNITKYNLNAKDDSIIFLVVPPHDDMKKWLLRIAPRSTFDRWANSVVVEREFDTSEQVNAFLLNNKEYIYLKMLNSLSKEVSGILDELEGLGLPCRKDSSDE